MVNDQEVGIEDVALPSADLLRRVRRVNSRLQYATRKCALGTEGLDEESAKLLSHFYSAFSGMLQYDPVTRLAYEAAHFDYFLERKTELEDSWEIEIPDF